MAEPRDHRQADPSSLEAIIEMGRPLVRLAGKIDWGFLDRRFGEVDAAGDGQPPLPLRPQAHAFAQRRGSVRALGGEPVFSVFLRRARVPPRARLRPLVADALAPAARRGDAFGAPAGEPAVAHETEALAAREARPGRPTSSAARCRSPSPSRSPKAASSSCTPRRYTRAIPSTATR